MGKCGTCRGYPPPKTHDALAEKEFQQRRKRGHDEEDKPDFHRQLFLMSEQKAYEQMKGLQREYEDEYIESLPENQFYAHVEEERQRMVSVLKQTKDWDKAFRPTTCFAGAREAVQDLWIEQGIWKNEWYEKVGGWWKHEEPLELEPLGPLLSRAKPKSDDKRRKIAELLAIEKREREASRPYYQFIFQVSKEREWLQQQSARDDDTDKDIAEIADINTKAYENVQDRWAKRRIWDEDWGLIPGMSWKHETNPPPFESYPIQCYCRMLESPPVESQGGNSVSSPSNPEDEVFGPSLKTYTQIVGAPADESHAGYSGYSNTHEQPQLVADVSQQGSFRFGLSDSKGAEPQLSLSDDGAKSVVRSKVEQKGASNVLTRSSARSKGVFKKR